jgi:hypothetical protein
MGPRRKFVYQDGALRDALFGDVVERWDVRREVFLPGEYRVELETNRGPVALLEDADAFWIEQHGDRRALSAATVRLPDFAGHPRAPLLRALHAELLVNILPWGPVPNLWVYPRPWYRDGAMMALCFERTGNAELLRPWIESLRFPFDYNNRGVAEADNPGQVLYLAGVAGNPRLPVVDAALKEVAKFRQGDHISGLSDYAVHPVYQTKWLKYGLKKLGLDDPYTIPQAADSYSALFWMDDREHHVPHRRFGADTLANYPYLNWAEAHFYGEPPPEPVAADLFPLSREVRASEADYSRMSIVSADWSAARWSSPHTWHAAEMFLYFLDYPAK